MTYRFAYLLRAVGAAVLCVAANAAQAQVNLEQMTQQWLDEALARNMPAQSPLRMEVRVGALDERLRLAPCTRVEPYLPTGARLWGRTRLGLRCQEGAVRWNVFLPVTVKAYGPAWVLTGDVTMGTVLSAADATEAEVDWAAENTSILAEPSLWVGLVASRHLKAGQALRQSMLRAPQIFQAGALVRVVAQGQGYAVSAAGQAMSAGAAGQTVRIRMDNGKIVSGIVNDDGTISVQL
ncbi:MAG: flagellar basal body P-ring formation chaperone FlgA [Giesbergeria sp.]|nr:flagellar basal body P-ring formation chaperone FlgA [Giesbergeria sp.]